MFLCGLCNGVLSGSQEILGTYCGHMFHQDCLENHLLTSLLCPSCRKSLRMDITTIEPGYAVLSLHPQLQQTSSGTQDEYVEDLKRKKNSKQNTTSQENAMLKRKLVEVYQALIVLQQNKDKQNMSQLSLPRKDQENSLLQNGSPILRHTPGKYRTGNNAAVTDIEAMANSHVADNTSYVTATETLDLMDPELVAVWDKTNTRPLSEEEMTKIYRSKRREYLTRRNKAHSWLTKMEVACNRLLQAGNVFPPKVYLQEIRMFFNKSYNQGRIIEIAKESAVVYLIMDQVSPDERSDIQTTILGLNKSYNNMMTKIMDKLNQLEGEHLDLGHSEKQLENDQCFQSVSTSIGNSDRCSCLSDEETERQENDFTVQHNSPKYANSKLIINLYSNEEDCSFMEPIFV